MICQIDWHFISTAYLEHIPEAVPVFDAYQRVVLEIFPEPRNKHIKAPS